MAVFEIPKYKFQNDIFYVYVYEKVFFPKY